MASRRRRAHVVFIVGGASSGKSEAALRLAAKGIDKAAPRAFVATGEGLDEEMTMKIARHRQSRSSLWVTAEVPLDLSTWFKEQGRNYRVVLVDCLTMWLSNHIERGTKEREILEEIRSLLRLIRQIGGRVVLVSNELGMRSVAPRSGRERGSS